MVPAELRNGFMTVIHMVAGLTFLLMSFGLNIQSGSTVKFSDTTNSTAWRIKCNGLFQHQMRSCHAPMRAAWKQEELSENWAAWHLSCITKQQHGLTEKRGYKMYIIFSKWLRMSLKPIIAIGKYHHPFITFVLRHLWAALFSSWG